MDNNFDESRFLRKIIGENMRTLRNAKDLSLDEVSELLDISSGYLGMVERGRRGLCLSRLIKFAKMFEITIDELLENKDNREVYSRQEIDSTLFTKINFFIGQLNQEEQRRLLIIIKAAFPCKIQ